MKKPIAFVLALVLCLAAHAQRYYSKVFDSVQITYNLQYGFNYDCNDSATNLYLDLFQPKGDTAHNRPMIILGHGGSFVQGSRSSSDMQAICTELALRGYVVASFDYRVKISTTSGNTIETEFKQAVWRATQDGKAAVRYFRKGIATGNALRIDDNNFYTGGVSAGGIIGMHLAFVDTWAEFNQIGLDTAKVGDMEGKSGNPGYSTRVKGVISLSGAIANTTWMNNNKNISLCFMHGTNDQTVPYKSSYLKFFGVDVAYLQGGFSSDSAAQKQGMDTRLYSFNGADHVPFVGNAQYMDTTVRYVVNYLYKHVTGLAPMGVDQERADEALLLYPNPAGNSVTIALGGIPAGNTTIMLVDMQGRTVMNQTLTEPQATLDTTLLPAGLYLVTLNQNGHRMSKHLVVR